MRFVFALALVALAVPAAAAEPSPLVDGIVVLIPAAATTVATVLVGALAILVKRLFGITLEARHREALHSALTTGASLALSVLAELIARGMGPEKARAVAAQHGVDYVRQSVPDALRALKPAEGLLLDMVRAKQTQLEFARSPAIVVTPPAPAVPAGRRG